jgi:hypothetical protein
MATLLAFEAQRFGKEPNQSELMGGEAPDEAGKLIG